MFAKARIYITESFSGDLKKMLLDYLGALENHRQMPQSPFTFCYYSGLACDRQEINSDYYHLHDMALISLALVSICPTSAAQQVQNLLCLQDSLGFLPAWVSAPSCPQKKKAQITFPPIWAFTLRLLHDKQLLSKPLQASLFPKVLSYINWFDKNRSTKDGGYYFLDILDGVNESRLNREALNQDSDFCLDASSYQYLLLTLAKDFSSSEKTRLQWEEKGSLLRKRIQNAYLCQYQSEKVSYLTLHPLMVGALAQEQVQNLVLRELSHFPLLTTNPSPSHLETLYIYLICHGLSEFYGYTKIARKALKSHLNQLSTHYQSTGSLWRYYSEKGLCPSLLTRNIKDLHHNPVINIVQLIASYKKSASSDLPEAL